MKTAPSARKCLWIEGCDRQERRGFDDSLEPAAAFQSPSKPAAFLPVAFWCCHAVLVQLEPRPRSSRRRILHWRSSDCGINSGRPPTGGASSLTIWLYQRKYVHRISTIQNEVSQDCEPCADLRRIVAGCEEPKDRIGWRDAGNPWFTQCFQVHAHCPVAWLEHFDCVDTTVVDG